MSDFTLTYGKVSCDYKNVHIENINICIPKKQLFIDTTINISFGRNYGFIGYNGQGKTTLLTHISKRLLPIHPDLYMLYVEQEVEPSNMSVLECVLEANVKKIKIENKIKILELNARDSDVDELRELYDELTLIGSDKDESKVRKILYGIGFTTNYDQNKAVKEYSGGWRMRIAIAKALYMEPTLLLLDEPTNHLDLNAVLWLTKYLSTWKNSLLVISHNQYFLNDICTDIINIEEKQLYYYKGNYELFSRVIQQKRKKHEKDWASIERRVKNMKSKSIPKKQVQEFLKNCTVTKPIKLKKTHITFGNASKLDKPSIVVDNISFNYDKDIDIIKEVDFNIDFETRITIVGNNGTGKSTFIKLLVGKLTPKSGEIIYHNSLRIAYYNQHFADILPLDKTPIQYLQTIDTTMTESQIRKILGVFGLDGECHIKHICNLSGGQKARVVLAQCNIINPHVLIMDEPTNHLDIDTITELINAINCFKGGVVIISHDMTLITETDCDLWVCCDKKIKYFDGTYDAYIESCI